MGPCRKMRAESIASFGLAAGLPGRRERGLTPTPDHGRRGGGRSWRGRTLAGRVTTPARGWTGVGKPVTSRRGGGATSMGGHARRLQISWRMPLSARVMLQRSLRRTSPWPSSWRTTKMLSDTRPSNGPEQGIRVRLSGECRREERLRASSRPSSRRCTSSLSRRLRRSSWRSG
jgi:hypothetical protein